MTATSPSSPRSAEHSGSCQGLLTPHRGDASAREPSREGVACRALTRGRDRVLEIEHDHVGPVGYGLWEPIDAVTTAYPMLITSKPGTNRKDRAS